MRKEFIDYYRPTKAEFAELWRECVFVLDANVLLNLYRYSTKARDDLLGVLEQVSDRLWIPHQAALEYQENRLGVIAEQIGRFKEVRDLLKKTEGSLKGGLAKLQLKKGHFAINPEGLLKKIEELFGEFREELNLLEKGQPDVSDDDNLRDTIDHLLKGKVGPPFESQLELDKLYEEGEARYAQDLPPGYKDKGKVEQGEPSIYLHHGLVIRRKYGDLILWFQIIREVKEKGLQHIVFVTDDRKEDWWWKVKSGAEKTIGPRRELVEELRRKANVSLFHMYTTERFLECANEHLDLEDKVDQESIDQARDIAQLTAAEPRKTSSAFAYNREAEEAVYRWLVRTFPDKVVSRDYPWAGTQYHRLFPPDFTVVDGDENITAVEVIFARKPKDTLSRINHLVNTGHIMIREETISEFLIVIVSDVKATALGLADTLDRLRLGMQEGVSPVVGHLGSDGEFTVLPVTPLLPGLYFRD